MEDGFYELPGVIRVLVSVVCTCVCVSIVGGTLKFFTAIFPTPIAFICGILLLIGLVFSGLLSAGCKIEDIFD